jgi:LysR family transcriptional regulator, transcriptional activator of nhaA
MEWLNYHHLLYFWTVVREGGLAKAAARLRLAHPTVSGQVHALEDALGEKLFQKQGRRLVLTEMGTLVYGYADEIFSLGRELLDTVKGRPTGRPLRLSVGIADVVPKLIARELLEPARQLGQKVQLVCREDTQDRLLVELAAHSLDVVLSDSPLPPGSAVRGFNHNLGETTVSFFGTRALADRYKKGFPGSLEGAPMLLPTVGTALRHALDQWFDGLRVKPDVVAEFDDSALMKTFGQDGVGLFPSPTVIRSAVRRQYDVEVVGEVSEVIERFYAISVERRIRHPAVAAICATARSRVFQGG